MAYLTWDPSQPVATRPLAIQKDGTWYTYGWDLTKNICEVYGQHGYIRTAYTYTPFGEVTAIGDVTQPIQWSSEFNDTELGLVYYNYRHYNPVEGRWNRRDPIGILDKYALYEYENNMPVMRFDSLGLIVEPYESCICLEKSVLRHGDRSKSVNLLLIAIRILTPFNDSHARYVTGRFCKFRCYKYGRDNCFSIPCRRRNCRKDHGVEVTVNIFSSSRSIPAALCEDVIEEVEQGLLDGGARVTRNYKGSY